MTEITLTQNQIDTVLDEHCVGIEPPVDPEPPIDPPIDPPVDPPVDPPSDWEGDKVTFASVYGKAQVLTGRGWATRRNVHIRVKDGFAFPWYYKPGRAIKFTMVGGPSGRGGYLQISTSVVAGDHDNSIQASGGDYGKIKNIYGTYSEGWYWCNVRVSPESWPAASAQGFVGVEMQYSEEDR